MIGCTFFRSTKFAERETSAVLLSEASPPEATSRGLLVVLRETVDLRGDLLRFRGVDRARAGRRALLFGAHEPEKLGRARVVACFF